MRNCCVGAGSTWARGQSESEPPSRAPAGRTVQCGCSGGCTAGYSSQVPEGPSSAIARGPSSERRFATAPHQSRRDPRRIAGRRQPPVSHPNATAPRRGARRPAENARGPSSERRRADSAALVPQGPKTNSRWASQPPVSHPSAPAPRRGARRPANLRFTPRRRRWRGVPGRAGRSSPHPRADRLPPAAPGRGAHGCSRRAGRPKHRPHEEPAVARPADGWR